MSPQLAEDATIDPIQIGLLESQGPLQPEEVKPLIPKSKEVKDAIMATMELALHWEEFGNSALAQLVRKQGFIIIDGLTKELAKFVKRNEVELGALTADQRQGHLCWHHDFRPGEDTEFNILFTSSDIQGPPTIHAEITAGLTAVHDAVTDVMLNEPSCHSNMTLLNLATTLSMGIAAGRVTEKDGAEESLLLETFPLLLDRLKDKISHNVAVTLIKDTTKLLRERCQLRSTAWRAGRLVIFSNKRILHTRDVQEEQVAKGILYGILTK